MKLSHHHRYGMIAILLCLGVYIVSRSFPFRFLVIPLGYDPWLYRSMFLAYDALGSTRAFDQLPNRILTMYEPLLGMVGALVLRITGGEWSDMVLTRGIVLCGALPMLWVGILSRRRSISAWLFAVFFAIFSFAQYQVFWWQYRKQLLAMFFLLVILWWRERGKILHMIPLLSWVFLLHRPAAVILLGVSLLRWGWMVRRREWKQFGMLVGSIFFALAIALPLLLPFRETLVLPMIWPFFSEIDLPSLHDVFQQGGTFLTLSEYFWLSWIVVLLSLWWVVREKKQNISWWTISILAYALLCVWVFWQWFFFQRMIGYFDLFVVLFAGSACAGLRQWNWIKKSLVLLLCVFQISMRWYRTYRTYRPLIEEQEFAFLSQIGKQIPADAIIIVPGIDYSPWVQGWTQREVLAPGLFDLNRRWLLDQERTTKWLAVSAKEKCVALFHEYPEMRTQPVYLWIGSKQPFTEIEEACFVLEQQGEGWSRWRLKPEGE